MADQKTFQVTEGQWQDVQARLEKQEGHRHTGIGDSLQLDPSNAHLYQNFYGLFKKVTFTAAQVKAFHSSPGVLVPAAGPKSIVIVDSVDAKLVFNTAAYTGSNNLKFFYTSASGASVAPDMAFAFLNAASSAYDHVSGISTELTPAANAPVVVSVPTANPAAGNSVLTFITRYRVLTF